MRALTCLILMALAAGCGQKGPLVLPKPTVATPVVIREPAPPAEPAAEPAQKKNDESEPRR